jgi:uncharacterized protein (TIGR04551 family)
MPRRSLFLVSLALAAPIAVPSIARAEDRAAPAASAAPSGAPPSGPPSQAAAPSAPVRSPADDRPPLVDSAPTPGASTAAPPAPAIVRPASIPARDQQDPATQATKPPDTGEIAGSTNQVFSDDWWGRVQPIVELHGYFRTRAQLFQNLALGRHGSSLQGNDPQYLAPLPLDQSYQTVSGVGSSKSITLCGSTGTQVCQDSTETSANMRLRLDPEIHISDNLRIVSEIFALDNVVLGSTPDAYAIQPSQNTAPSGTQTTATKTPAYQSAGYNPYAPVGFLTTTQGPPTAGVNSLQNSINVQRVWGEYMTPVGQLRFGRMPGQWGLGMVENSGDGIDSDYQTTLDRIMFITGIKSMDLYFGGAWDYVSTGPTNATAYSVDGGQPYNTCNLCNVNEWAAFVVHRTNPELQRLSLSRGDLVVNGGLYTKFRSQNLDVASSAANGGPQTPQTLDLAANDDNGLETRQAWALTPDLWVQALWRKLRFEAEGAMIYGEVASLLPNASAKANNSADIRQFGVVTQTEYRAVEDKLDLQFGFGWSSGDPWAYNTAAGVNQGALNPGSSLPQEYNAIGPISTFRFHPDYHVDLLFFRNILSRVEGAYYFRPSVDYDFLHHTNGEKFGGGAAVIWSRASDFVQTPGHHRDLGVELDLQLYYQSKDGSLNDDPTKVGGFYTMLQYGVFFPLAGLDYLPSTTLVGAGDTSLSTAQTVRLFLGVVF